MKSTPPNGGTSELTHHFYHFCHVILSKTATDAVLS